MFYNSFLMINFVASLMGTEYGNFQNTHQTRTEEG